MKLVVLAFCVLVLLSLGGAVEPGEEGADPPDPNPFKFTEQEAVMRVVQLLGHKGEKILIEEVIALLVALGNGPILHQDVPSTSSGHTSFLTTMLQAAGITASNGLLLRGSISGFAPFSHRNK